MIGGGDGGGGGAIALMHPSVSKLNEIGFYFKFLVLLFVIDTLVSPFVLV